MNFDRLKIKDYKYWSLFLNENQCYLGRVSLVARRKDADDFIDMTLPEREEFFLIGNGIKKALKALFQLDLINYASLGNTYRHLHIHFIPRYETKRVFHGTEFIDARWGKNYEPYDRNFKLSAENLDLIKVAFQGALEKCKPSIGS